MTGLGGQWQVLEPVRFTGWSCHTAVKKFKVALLYCHEKTTMQQNGGVGGAEISEYV